MDEINQIVGEATEKSKEDILRALRKWVKCGRPGVFRYVSDIDLRKKTITWRLQDATLSALITAGILTGGYLIYKKLHKKKTEK